MILAQSLKYTAVKKISTDSIKANLGGILKTLAKHHRLLLANEY